MIVHIRSRDRSTHSCFLLITRGMTTNININKEFSLFFSLHRTVCIYLDFLEFLYNYQSTYLYDTFLAHVSFSIYMNATMFEEEKKSRFHVHKILFERKTVK